MSTARRRLLDDTYKKTASGNPIITRTVARMNPDLKVYGWTEQDEYSGAQLYAGEDVEMTWNATDENGNVSAFMVPLQAGDVFENGGYLSFYCTDDIIDSVVIELFWNRSGNNNYSSHVIGNLVSGHNIFTLPQYTFIEDQDNVWLQIRRNKITTTQTFTLSQIFVKAGQEPGEYEPYTGGNPAPNPEYPIPWHSAGEVMTTGAQVYDQSLAEDNLYQNFDAVNQNLTISNNPNYWISGKVPVKPNTTYSINKKCSGGCFYSDENTPITTSVIVTGTTFTTPENCNFVVVNFVKTSVSFDAFIMMNVGSVPLPWEPYTGGVPGANPYKGQVDINITGRNLFDASLFTDEDLAGTLVTNNGDGSFTVADSYTEWTSMNVKKNLSDEMTRMLFHPGTLHINCWQTTYPYFEINFYKNDENVISGTNLGLAYRDLVLPNSYFEKNNGDEIHVQYVIYSAPDGESKFNPGTFRPMIYYDGNGSFEPYKEPQSLPLVLEAPLTKWDRIEQRNGELGVVRKSAAIVLDGSEDEAFSIYETPEEGKSFAITLNDSVGGYQTSLCDKYRNINAAWSSEHKDEYVIYSDHMNGTNKTRYFRPPSTEVETVEQWKTWLQQNPLTLLYETSEETFELSSASMWAQHTYSPSTSVYNWQNCNMDFTYKTRKSVEDYNLIDFGRATYVGCTYLGADSIQLNTQSDYGPYLKISYLNDFIMRNKGKKLRFSCEGTPSLVDEMFMYVGVGIWGTFEDGTTDESTLVMASKSNAAAVVIPDNILSVDYVRLDPAYRMTAYTDTETIITNLKLTIE